MEFIFAVTVLWLALRGMTGGDGTASGTRAGPRVGKYGLWDHLRDSYRDSWMRSTDDMIARRDARAKAHAARQPATGSRWQRRWDRAEDRAATRREPEFRSRETGWRRRHRTDTPEPTTNATPQAEPPKTDPPAPAPAAEATPAPVAPDQPEPRRLRLVPQPDETDGDKPEEGQPAPTPTPEPNTSEGAPTMSNTGGEVPNFESHEAELLRVIRECEEGIDLCNVVVSTSTTLRGQVDDLQTKYGPVATATQNRADQLQGMKIDAETQANAAEGADALDPNAVANYHDEAEGIENGAVKLRERLERAKASAEAELANIRRRYADPAETVQRDLGGDGSYLGGVTLTNSTGHGGVPAYRSGWSHPAAPDHTPSGTGAADLQPVR